MRILKSTVFRALCAIAIGYMLIKFPADSQAAFIRAIGALFFASGAISWASYFYQKKNEGKVDIFDEQGNKLTQSSPFFPIAGSGSIILGIILILVPNTLQDIINKIFGAMIMLGAFNQFMNLMKTRQYAQVPVFYWIVTSFVFLVGLLITLEPEFLSELIMPLCGWCFIAYAFLEVLISVQLAIFKHKYNKANQQMQLQKAEQENTELIENIEPETIE